MFYILNNEVQRKVSVEIRKFNSTNNIRLMAFQAAYRNRKLPRLHILSYSLAGLALILSACATGTGPTGNTGNGNTSAVPTQIPTGPIKHIVFFIKENRTFDNYFGTYPGADRAVHDRRS